MRKYILIGFILLVNSLSRASSLDDLANKYRTDKRCGDHGYTRVYEKYFSSLQDSELTLLEIGLAGGASAHMWGNYFSKAELHFIDNDPNTFDRSKISFLPRCFFHLLDQGDKQQLHNFAQDIGKQFDIIIDDGSHQCAHQILTFKYLFPLLKKDGIYVIEDLHTSYWQMYGGAGNSGSPKLSSNSAIKYFLSLVHDVNYIGALTGYADEHHSSDEILNKLSYYQRHIESIHFYTSMCFIIKK